MIGSAPEYGGYSNHAQVVYMTAQRSALAVTSALLATICATCVPVQGQDIEERIGSERPSPRIILVIDVSSSMRSKIADAVEWAITNVVDVGHEDVEIGIITFNHTTMRHVDKLDGERTKEWFRLPAAPVLKRLMERLRSLGTSGTTIPDEGLRQALRTGAQCLVFITDGEFNSGSDPLAVVKEAQRWSEESKRPLPIVSILGVHPGETERTVLEEIATKSGGQLWIRERPHEAEDEDIDLPAPTPKPRSNGPKVQGPPSPPKRKSH